MNRAIHFLSILVLFVLVLSACGTKNHPYLNAKAVHWKDQKLPSDRQAVHTLYLIGDAGKTDRSADTSNFVVNAMASMMDMNEANSSVVYLGDNIYPIGLVSEKNKKEREKGEQIVYAQMKPLREFKGRTYIIPGNHDWNKDKKGGLEAIKRQEAYIETNFGNSGRVHFYPNMGCGDPEVVKVNKEIVYIFIDSQWWLHNWNNENEINQGCDIKSRWDFLKRMEELFLKYKNKEIICMLHHPIKSNGNHGGYFSFQQHIFPMAELGIWIPLPGLGSIYPIYRQATGSIQDNTHIKNQNLTKGLESLAKKYSLNVVFASGHEHGLEFYESSKIKYIVSGSGAKTSYIQSGGEAVYAREARGFARIIFYEHFESWLEYYTVSGYDEEPRLEFRTMLREARPGTVEDETTYPPLQTRDTLIAANPDFGAGSIKKLFLGEQYRDMWMTPVKAEMIDLESKLGGMTPIKKGGGMSSNSLRIQHDSGKQYILRSIKKDYRKLVPEGFENLRILDIMKDQNSASHPYGALAVPTLSKAAGIYYTEPKLVYLKHQRGLGNYNSQFPEELYLLEERPAGNWQDEAKFGNSEEIISYADLLKNLRTKKNHFIDQKWVLKSRIFDLWIHDWDRHDDQWRWAKFKEGEKTIYRPIPRDRDQVFYKFTGIIPTLVAAFLMPKFKTMKHNVRDVKNLAFNAKHFDRYFLHELEWSDWLEVIQNLQADMTDEVIEEAMSHIPEAVKDIDNPEIISKLQSRRTHLVTIGKKLYDFLSEEVEITGSDNKDLFLIDYLVDGSLYLKHYIKKERTADILKYQRTFYPEETKEIRIYGFREDDIFKISGEKKSNIQVRIIGGEGKDELYNDHPSARISVYDDLDGIQTQGKIADFTSDDYLINEYDRNEFQYDTGFPLLNFGKTVDDGWWLGGGYSWINKGWRKDPFKSKNLFSFSIAPGSQNAFQVTFTSENRDLLQDYHFVPDALKKMDMLADVSVNFPRYENYFGLGNNSINELRGIQYNWVRMQSIELRLRGRANFSKNNYFTFGPMFQSQDVDNTEGRVSEDDVLGFNADQLERRNYLGFTVSHHMHFVDNSLFPANGFKFHAQVDLLSALNKNEYVAMVDVSASAYIQLMARPKIVLANAVGYRKTGGDLQFHQYADLGNRSNLRGFRNNRFRGESAFYHNIDLRFHLYDWDNNWLPMKIGIVGGYDYGRVWLEEEISNTWHRSYTSGVSFNILDLVVVQPYYSFVGEREDDVFTLLMGFSF